MSEDKKFLPRWGVYRTYYTNGHQLKDGDPIANYEIVDTDEGVSVEFRRVEYPRRTPYQVIKFKVEISGDYEIPEERTLKSLRNKAKELHGNDPKIQYIVPLKHFSEKNEAIDYAKELNEENEKKEHIQA